MIRFEQLPSDRDFDKISIWVKKWEKKETRPAFFKSIVHLVNPFSGLIQQQDRW